MKNRIITALLALAVCVSLAACGTDREEKEETNGEAEIEASEEEAKSDTDENTEDAKKDEEKPEGEEIPEAEDTDNEAEEIPVTTPEVTPEPIIKEDVAQTATGKIEAETFDGDYYMSFDIIYDMGLETESTLTCTYAIKGEDNYFRIKNEVMDFSLIKTEKEELTLDNNNKQYLMGIPEFLAGLRDVAKRLRISNVYGEDAESTTGEIEILGTKYTYEAFDANTKYAFDENKDLKYVTVTDTDGAVTYMRITELTKEIPEGLFGLPEGYELLEAAE